MPIVSERIVQEVQIEVSPETIFEFFTDPQKMLRWQGMEANIDPKPGGTYHVKMKATHTAIGEYVAVEPPRRVVFTWGWESDENIPPGSSTVEITLEKKGGSTLVRLTHSDLPEPARQPHADGWAHYLERLVVVGAGGDPGPDRWMEEPAS